LLSGQTSHQTAMLTRCPHCRAKVELTADDSLSDIDCGSCGSMFSIVEEKTIDYADETTAAVGGRIRSKQIGHFKLLSELGAGSFGSVWKAQDTELDRMVAIKFPHKEQLDGAEAEKFLREARAAAQLRHPGIVSVHEIGRDDDTIYIVGDFIHGLTLAEWMADQQVSSRETAELCAKLADALDHAHEAGVIHRDFKPGNVMIDHKGEPHVLDFGLAKREVGEVTMTIEGRILGTPAYMSPEQARGEGYKADRRTDIYALGATLYQLLTGETPFRGNQRMILHQLLTEEPRPPRSLNDRIPADLETICLKCLEKDPERRYPTAREVADELRRWLRREPIQARPISRTERLWRWCRRNAAVAALSATAMLLVLLVAVVSSIGYATSSLALAEAEQARTRRALAQIDTLLTAEPESIPLIIDNLDPDWDEILPRLRALLAQVDLSERERLRVRLALLRSDPSQVPYICGHLLSAQARELAPLRAALLPYKQELRGKLWGVLEKTDVSEASRFRAALALASYDPPGGVNDPRWQAQADFIAGQLIQSIVANLSLYEPWVEALRPAREPLLAALAGVFRDRRPKIDAQRRVATNVLATYAIDRPEFLAALIRDADTQQFVTLMPSVDGQKDAVLPHLISLLDGTSDEEAISGAPLETARRRGNTALVLMQLGEPDRVWPLFAQSDDPTVRSYLVHDMARVAVDPQLIIDRLVVEQDTSARRALILALGEYPPELLSSGDCRAAVEKLQLVAAFRDDADPGFHSAVEWLLMRWDFSDELQATQSELKSRKPQGAGDWYVTAEGHTMAILEGKPFTMGSPGDEMGRSVAERPVRKELARTFAISSKEVTVAQFQRYLDENPDVPKPGRTVRHSPDPDGPMSSVAWYHAAGYCRWLSEKEGIPEVQMCYPPVVEVKNGMSMPADYLGRSGYRLPTEGEWEFACRARSETSRFFGKSEEMLDHYAWHVGNSQDRAWPTGSLKPNDHGLFDMLGNVWEWCQDRWMNRWSGRVDDTGTVDADTNRVLRGGSFDSSSRMVRSAYYDRFEKPTVRSDEIGFRIARTFPE
jgi:formylglycine-generating enzyme required for sulfatase activity